MRRSKPRQENFNQVELNRGNPPNNFGNSGYLVGSQERY
jgi:hypothetical protein